MHFCEGPKLHPVAYFSRKLTLVERNDDIRDQEWLAVKLVLEEWWHWLEGAAHPFTIFVDHKNLKYLKTARHLKPRQSQ